MHNRLVLLAKYLLTPGRPRPLEDAFVQVQGHRIVQVGRRRDLYAHPAVRVLDLGETVLLPGLVNAHCHLEFTHLRGEVPYRGSFPDWLRRMGEASRAHSPEIFRRAAREGVAQALEYGTTSLCDTSTTGESYPVLRASGLRGYLFFEVSDVVSRRAADAWEAFEARWKDLVRRLPPTALFRWGLSPHTPFTASRELFRRAGRFLDAHRGVLTSVHVAESRAEGRYFRTGRGEIARLLERLQPSWVPPRDTTSVRHLNRLGWLPKVDLAVHLNVVDERDLDLLARNRVAAVHCPGSRRFFGHPRFPYEKFRRHRIPVCLGTDSLASNRSLSLFREMRLFCDDHPGVPPEEVLRLPTVRAARALRREHDLGDIAPGRLADLVGIPAPRSLGRGDPQRRLCERVIAYARPVAFSMVDGKVRWRVVRR